MFFKIFLTPMIPPQAKAMRLMDDFVSPLKGLQRPTDEAEKASLVGLEFLAGLLQHPAKNIR